jgi:hypothetical protein
MITKEQALLFKKRWETVNHIQLQESRNSSPSEKLEQLTTLMKLAKELKWVDQLNPDVQKVRERWMKLKKHYNE